MRSVRLLLLAVGRFVQWLALFGLANFVPGAQSSALAGWLVLLSVLDGGGGAWREQCLLVTLGSWHLPVCLGQRDS